MRNILARVSLALLCVGLSSEGYGSTSEVQRVIDVSGGISSNGTFKLASAVGQPQPVGVSYNSSYLLNAGFLQSDTNEATAGTDTDGDGFIVERVQAVSPGEHPADLFNLGHALPFRPVCDLLNVFPYVLYLICRRYLFYVFMLG